MRSANAVAARIALDLRVGAAMTRMQTFALQSRFELLSDKVISYGKHAEGPLFSSTSSSLR